MKKYWKNENQISFIDFKFKILVLKSVKKCNNNDILIWNNHSFLILKEEIIQLKPDYLKAFPHHQLKKLSKWIKENKIKINSTLLSILQKMKLKKENKISRNLLIETKITIIKISQLINSKWLIFLINKIIIIFKEKLILISINLSIYNKFLLLFKQIKICQLLRLRQYKIFSRI